MQSVRPLVRAIAVLSFAAPALHAQLVAARADSLRDDRSFTFYDRGPYRASVPRPESILGYEVGEMNTQFAAQERTLLAIADAAKDRVRVEEIGSTYERRTMRLYIISAPENIARLDAIRADLDRIADPRNVPPAELDALVKRTPAVVWINESVHGNESPGFETAMQTLYQLAASEEPATTAALRNTIVVLNPSTNPDGHERFTVWYNSIAVRDPEPGAMEHREPWSIQGRYNHYRFDMNRDVMSSTQREVQTLLRGMLRWHPMVAIDQHGQVNTYFFPPAARPVNLNLGEAAAKWLDLIGRGNAAAFDRYGWMYFVRDTYDLYGPFYWDTWPGLTGATGMTYETDGGGWKGILWRREDGSLVSFRDGIAKHYVSAIATIETTAGRREERVRDYLRFRQGAVAEGRSGAMKQIVLLPGSDPGRAAELVSTALRSGIEVRRTTAPFASARAHAYADDATGARRFDAGAYVIDLAQPQGKLAKALFEPTPTLDPVFAKAQEDKFRRNLRRGGSGAQEGYEFYDITAWSLPVAFGVETYWTEDAPAVAGALLALPAGEPALPQAQQAPAPAAPAVQSDANARARAGARVRSDGGEPLAVEIPSGIVAGAGARTAYLFRPDRNGASRLAYHLLDEGFRLSVAAEPIEAGERTWPRGSYVVRVARNDSTLAARLDALARESGVEVTGVNSAYTGEGQFGVGSGPIVPLVAPRIAMLGDEGVSQTSYGAMWWVFERRYGIRFTPITYAYLTGGDLSKFNVIIFPDASAGGLTSRLGRSGADRLRSWMQSGGTLVTMGGASAWAASEGVNFTSARAVGATDSSKTAGPATAAGNVAAANPTRDSASAASRRRGEIPDKAQRGEDEELIPVASPSASPGTPAPVPGSNFDVVLDRTHWLTFGYERPRLTVLFEGNTFYKLSKDGANVAIFPSSGKLVRAGFVWPDNTARLLRGTAFLIQESVGGGHLVAFANEPMFRGWWRSLDRLVLNAVTLGPAF
ncbi:MAG: M14 family zinc carboxypeptidase [Gemmatimonadaceae bacterium]